MDPQKKRCWAEISLANIEHNYHELRSRLPKECRFLGVVKANAYGHGAVKVAKLLEELGADYLAVAYIDEAVELRKSGITLPILILGVTAPKYTAELIKYSVTQAVASSELALAYAREAKACGAALRCHLKLDSGMGRTGFKTAASSEAAAILGAPNLDFEGVFTHFAVSDAPGSEAREYTDRQYDGFMEAVRGLENAWGRKFKIVHCTNSGAMLNYPQTYGDMVRPGILLYGHYPDRKHGEVSLRPAMSLKTRIVQIKEFSPGESVSYGRIWIAQQPSRIAVLSIGYADGLSRNLSGRAEFLLHGKRIRQVGRICMDMCMADITGVDEASVGDEVLIFGQDAGGGIPIEEHCEKLGTISYELLCDVAARVPRVYTN